MTRWKRTLTAAALALVMLAGLAVPAFAAAEVLPTEGDAAPAEGEITAQAGGVKFIPPESFAEDLASATVDVDVYKVADLDLETGLFTLVGAFTALEDENWTGILGPDDAYVEELWDAASKLVSARTMDPEATPAPGEGTEPTPEPTEEPESSITPDFTAEGVALDGNGRIEIMQKLGAGLYLIVPRSTQTAEWVYTFGSGLLSMPSTVRETNSWNYELTAYLKAERDRRLMDLEINKNLLHYNRTLGPATFVFDVIGRMDEDGDGVAETVVFQTTAEITFSDDSSASQTVTVKNIPVGAEVTVTEVYTGESYTLVSADGSGASGAATGDHVTFEISELTLPEGQEVHRVEFTNDYTGSLIPDNHVENIYTADGQAHWSWASDKSEGGNG